MPNRRSTLRKFCTPYPHSSNLLEDRSNPDSRHSHSLQVPKFGGYAFQCSATEFCSRIEPWLWVWKESIAFVGGLEGGRGSFGHFIAAVIDIAILLVVRESVWKKKIPISYH